MSSYGCELQLLLYRERGSRGTVRCLLIIDAYTYGGLARPYLRRSPLLLTRLKLCRMAKPVRCDDWEKLANR